MNTDKKAQMIIRNCAKFTTLGRAKHFGIDCIKSHMVVLGDDGRYWSMTVGEAMYLTNRGYELA